MTTLTCGLRVKTSARLTEIESWQKQNCFGLFDLELESIGNLQKAATVAVYFALPADRDKFRASCNLILRKAAA